MGKEPDKQAGAKAYGDLEQRLEQTLAKLRTERDELKVRMHLANAEMREEWDELEKKWAHADARLKAARKEARGASRDVAAAVEVLGDEIARAYARIRDRLRG
ncbi:MAG TPA: hypothetical protein VLA56_15480 [Pseudomonadales bacterium]|nr:hypothetical protein [Pseudomonadales bacterium]